MGQYPGYGRNLQQRIDRSIELVGQAALDDAIWPAVVDSIREVLGADSALLFTPTINSEDPSSLWVGKALNGESITRYQAYFHKIDQWTHEIEHRNIASDTVIIGDDVVATSALKKSEWYNDFLREYDILYLTGTKLLRPHQSFPFTYASFYRSPRSEPFDDLERNLYSQIIPHLRRSLEVRGRLAGSALSGLDATAALDALAQPIILIDASGRAIFVNKSADLRMRQRGSISVRSGRLQLENHDDNEALERAIWRILNGKAPAVETVPTRSSSGTPNGVILIAPLPPGVSHRAAAIVIVGDGQQRNATRTREFARIHGLTPTETALVEGLSVGLSLQDLALQRHVSVNTVNKQVKQTMAKIGCHRQADIVRYFLCFPVIHDSESLG